MYITYIMLKRDIECCITEALTQSDIGFSSEIILEAPRHENHGDYSTNVAFQLAKQLRQSPMQISERVATVLNADSSFLTFAFASPLNGFVNIQLHDRGLWSRLNRFDVASFQFPKLEDRFLVEYVSANPTGPLHIGHGRWAVIGSSLVTLLKRVGADVHSEFYINDAGNQVNLFYASVNGVKNGQGIPENGYHGAYITDLANSTQNPLQAMLASQRYVLSTLGVNFDCWFSESTLTQQKLVDAAISRLRELGFIYDSKGAVWFKSTYFGDDKDRVVIKADGSYTYFASDISYHFHKLSRGYTRLINLFGADHHGYVRRIKACVKAFMGAQYIDDVTFTIIIGQLVNLFRDGHPVRMSKRTGDMIMLEDVIDEIGVDATRYFLLEKSPDTHLDFDLSLAVKKSSENPVFYVQYAYARICTILSKVDIHSLPSVDESAVTLSFPERCLVIEILRLEDVLWHSAMLLAPYKVVHYTAHLARLFHLFYETSPILKAEPQTQAVRVAILKKLQVAFGECFGILGISAPQSM